METLVWTGPKRMEVQQREEPRPAESEVLIKVEAVGICGSEIEGYLGHNSLRVPPLVMGHEFSGRVYETGANVDGFARGQHVVINPILSCGTCNQCRKGLPQLCAERGIIGVHRPGAFAEFVSVPASSVHIIPDALSPYRASLTEPLACSLRAARRALQNHPFANVVVFGAGTIGLLSFLVAQILGAAKIMVVDTNEARLRTPANLGAYGTITPEADYIQKIKEAMGPAGIDVIIDAAGFQPTRTAAMELINLGGTIMNIGLGIDDTVLPINHCIRSEINILGSFSYHAQDFYDALELLKAGRIDETQWSEIRSLKEGDGAFQDLINHRVQQAKIFLTP